jgi:GNAT superfamily N-acetyltransferase
VSGPQVHVRPTRPDDLPELEDMWSEIQEAGGRLARALGRGDSGQRLAALARHSAGRLLVAEIDSELVGMAFVQNQSLVPLIEVGAVHVGFIHVRAAHRGRGIGKGLINGVLDYAAEVGAAEVSVAVDPAMRDANRFFARLGMRPLMTFVLGGCAAAPARRRRASGGRRARSDQPPAPVPEPVPDPCGDQQAVRPRRAAGAHRVSCRARRAGPPAAQPGWSL